MSKRRDINLFPTANSPPCLCGFYSAHKMDCRHAMSYLAALGQMKDMGEFIRERVPAYYWWSTYCAAFEDVAIISPNLAKIDKIVDIISIDTALPATTIVVVRPPPMIKKHGPNTQKRIPSRGDTSTYTSTNKRKYTKAKNEPTTALSIGLDAPAPGRHRRTTAGKQSSRFGDSSSDDDCLAAFTVDEVVVVEVDTDGDDRVTDLIGGGGDNKDREGKGGGGNEMPMFL